METSKYTTRRDDRLREIQSQATDFAQDLMQEGVKDMAIHNITMKKVCQYYKPIVVKCLLLVKFLH